MSEERSLSQAFLLLQQTPLLALQLLDARALDLRFALAVRHRLRMRLPGLLPGRTARCSHSSRVCDADAPRVVRRVEAGHHASQVPRQAIQAGRDRARGHRPEVRDLGLGLLEIRALALAQLAA